MRRAAALALAASMLCAAGARAADRPSNTFDLIDDSLANILKPGQAEVAVGGVAWTWSAVADHPASVQVSARPADHPRPGTLRRVFVRWKRPSRRCGRSYARDSGRIVSYPDLRPSAARLRPDPRGMLGLVRPSGNVIVGTEDQRLYRWRTPQTVRFCVWLGRRASTRIRPVTQDVRFHGTLFGATVARLGSIPLEGGEVGYAAGASATFPFHWTQTPSIHDLACTRPSSEDVTVEPSTGIYGGMGFEDFGGPFCPVETLTFSPLAAGMANLTAGSLSFTQAESVMPHGQAPVRHLGNGCDFDASVLRNRDEAQAYVQAVGCQVGRLIFHSRPNTPLLLEPKPRSGEVYAYSVHGALAYLVPRGSRVDLLIDP